MARKPATHIVKLPYGPKRKLHDWLEFNWERFETDRPTIIATAAEYTDLTGVAVTACIIARIVRVDMQRKWPTARRDKQDDVSALDVRLTQLELLVHSLCTRVAGMPDK
jgi:hypothetical protein